MTFEDKENAPEKSRRKLIGHLRELVEALDRRVPHPEREGEQRIASDSAMLKKKALERIGQLETDSPL